MTATLLTTIGLGHLVDLIVRDAQGQRLRLTPHGERWLAWKPDTHDLVILRPGRGVGTVAKRGDARCHRTFHGAAPKQARPMEWPAPRGNLRALGLIESVTYTAGGIRSPSKKSHHWIHQFGDRGERGHGPATAQETSQFDDRLFPRLDVDPMGNLFVVRRNGNRYLVRDWIIG